MIATTATVSALSILFGGPWKKAVGAAVTRAVVLELCREAGYEVCEKPIFEDELWRADEVFLAGTTAEVTPVLYVDDRVIGTGRPGSLALDLLDRLRRRARPV